MTETQQAGMVGQQNATLAQQAEDKATAGQNAARIKLEQNAPGVMSDDQRQVIDNARAGTDPVAGSQAGGPTTSFMDQFKTAGSNALSAVGSALTGPTESTATEAGATGGDGGAPVDSAGADSDNDGQPDATDQDDDNDGQPDATDQATPAQGTGTWANQAPVGGQSGGGGKVPGWRGAMDWGAKNPGKSFMLGGLPQIAAGMGAAAEWAGNKWFGQQGQPQKNAMEKMYLYNPELAAHLAYSSTMKSFREVDTTEAVRVAYR